jgi:hypothetical protein
MPRTGPSSAFPAQFDNLLSAGPRLATSLLRANQRNLQSLATFYVQQAENARLTAAGFFADIQPLFKATDPADFMHGWLKAAEKCTGESLKRLRDSVDECRGDCFKATIEAADETAPVAEAAVATIREPKVTAKAA